MAMEFYGMPILMYNIIEGINSGFTIIFAIEMILKLCGQGIRKYVRDLFNVFDAFVVIFGLLDFVNMGKKAFTVLRIFRLLRMMKILR